MTNPAVRAAVAGIEVGAIEWPVVQAVLLSPLAGLMGDPARDLLALHPTITPEEFAGKIKAERAKLEKGVPPFLTAIVADVQLGDTPATIISLAYTECALAEEAARQIKELWSDHPLRQAAPSELTAQTKDANDRLCLAVLTFKSHDRSETQNPLFDRLRIALLTLGDPSLLRIGVGPRK
jgi:hypothetical protein